MSMLSSPECYDERNSYLPHVPGAAGQRPDLVRAVSRMEARKSPFFQEGGDSVLDGAFVFDCVIHAYNMSDANLLDRPDAELGRGSILSLGAQTRAPGA